MTRNNLFALSEDLLCTRCRKMPRGGGFHVIQLFSGVIDVLLWHELVLFTAADIATVNLTTRFTLKYKTWVAVLRRVSQQVAFNARG